MHALGGIIHGLNRVARVLSGTILLIMTFALFLNIVGRNFLGYSYVGMEALGTYLMVWLTFIGAAFIVPAHGHVAVDLLLRAAGPRLMRAVVIFTALIGMVTAAYMALIGYELARFIFSTGQVETTLNVSAGFLYLPVPLGMALMCINYADLMIALLRKDDSRLPAIELAAKQDDAAREDLVDV